MLQFSWEVVRQKMINEKGLNDQTADRIGEYVKRTGGMELIETLLNDKHLSKVTSAVNALNSMKLLLEYCHLFGLTNEVVIDLSLARGLDYYTGIIYEAILKPELTTKNSVMETVGSVAGGGRYDNLVKQFDPNGIQVPCVGLSIGVERIFTILDYKYKVQGTKQRTKDVNVYVISAHKGLHKQRLGFVSKLWDAGISAEHSYKHNPKILLQLQYCEKTDVPLAIILGEKELSRGKVILRSIETRNEELIKIDDVIDAIQNKLINLNRKQ